MISWRISNVFSIAIVAVVSIDVVWGWGIYENEGIGTLGSILNAFLKLRI
jgi:hypothetical protein